MMVDTTVYGYVVNDCETVCTDCLSEGDTVNARLYYLDDENPFGVSGDGCSEYIFEPIEEHAFVVDTTPYALMNRERCRECGYERYEAPQVSLRV